MGATLRDGIPVAAQDAATQRALIGLMKKNYVVNGAMQVSQENGTTAGTANAYYPVDQFRSVISGTTGVASFQQVASATPGGSPNRLRVTVTTADAALAAGDLVSIIQNIEGTRTADLRAGSALAKTITVQFGVKAPAGTYGVALQNGAGNRSRVEEFVISGGEANTDVVKSVTVPLDTTGTWAIDNTTGLTVKWTLMAGSTFTQTASSWQATGLYSTSNQFNFMGTISNVFELFDVSLTEGSAAPAFQAPDYSTELLKCQRYWQSILARLQAYSAASDNIMVTHRYIAEMRATPSVTFSSTTYTNASGIGTTSPHDSKGITVYATATAGGQANYSTTISLSARL